MATLQDEISKKMGYTQKAKVGTLSDYLKYFDHYLYGQHPPQANNYEQKAEYLRNVEEFVINIMSSERDISKSQIRNFFNTFNMMKSEVEMLDFLPNVYYLAANISASQFYKDFLVEFLVPLMQKVTNKEKLLIFQHFFKDILCYHSYYSKN